MTDDQEIPMRVKCFTYGCAPLPEATRDAIFEQLRLAFRYRFMLWNLSMAGRRLYREQRREHTPELVDAEEEFDRLKALFGELNAQLKEADPGAKGPLKNEIQRVKVERERVKALCRELREAAKTNEAFQADTKTAQERYAILGRALRNVFSQKLGLYSGTYLHVEAAARSANGGKEDPVRPVWRGEGALAIQLQGGRSFPQLCSGTDASLRIHWPKGPLKKATRSKSCRGTIDYRVRSRDGHAVFVTLPAMLRREPPPDAQVIWAKLVVRRIHEFRTHFSVQLTVKSAQYVDSTGAGDVFVAFGGDEVRLYDPFEGSSTFDTKSFIDDRLRQLQSERDILRNEAIAHLVRWCESQDETADWVRDEIARIEERRSCRRLYHLRNRLRKIVDESVMEFLDTWAREEDKLYERYSNRRNRALNRRQDTFNVFARSLARKYRTLVVDSRHLNQKERLTYEKRWQGLHFLRLSLIRAFGPDNVVQIPATTCEELVEKRKAPADVSVEKKKTKRTGFARKHEERRRAAE